MNYSFKVTSFNELLNDDSKPPKPIIDNGVLLDGTLLLLIGPPKLSLIHISEPTRPY